MYKINIVCVGGLKEKYYMEAQNDYLKRLSKFCKVTVTELSEQKLPNNPSEQDIKNNLEKEAKQIEKHLMGFVFVCDVLGKKISSPELAKNIQKTYDNFDTITFVIGSSYGLSESIKQKGNARISFSDCTFPHHLMRIILLEQIYRGMCINNNVTYHK